MSVRTETLQLRVLIDGSPARRELAQLDQEYAKINSELKDLKKGTREYTDATKRLSEIGVRQAELRKEIGLTGLTAKQLGDELRRLQVAQRNLTPNTQQWAENAAQIETVKQRLRELNDVNHRAAAAWEEQRKSIKLTNMSMVQLEMEARRLQGMLRNMDPGTARFRHLNQELAQVNARLTAVQATAGRVGIAFNRMGGQILMAAGLGSGIFALFSVIRGGLQTTLEFEQAQANLAAVMGVTKREVKDLSDESKEYGRTTAFTAAQVSALQTEFAKLGFNRQEIKDATRDTLNLAAATGTDLARAAAVAGVTVRGFGMLASDTGRAADVMAMSFTKSALDMEKYAESAKYVAPIARAANIEFETTTAVLGKLADAGLSGSMAGTSVRNLFSKLSDDNSKLSKELGFSVRSSEDLFKAFEQLRLKNIDLSEATELTDERSKAAFITLVNGAEDVRKLADELKNAGGAAQKMAEEQLDTLRGDMVKAKSAWEGLVLSIEDGSGRIGKFFRVLVQGATELFQMLSGSSEGQRRAAREAAHLAEVQARVNQIYGEGTTAGVDFERSQKGIAKAMHDRRIQQEAALKADEEMMLMTREVLTNELARININKHQTAYWKMQTAAIKETIDKIDEVIAKRQAEAASATSAADTLTSPDAPKVDDEVKKKREAARAELENLRQDMLKAQRELELAAMSGDERELARIDDKHKAIRVKTLAHYDEMRRLGIYNAQEAAGHFAALDEQHANERANAIQEQGEKRIEAARKEAEKIREAITEEQEKMWLEDLDREDAEITRQMQHMERIVALYEEGGEDISDVVERTERSIAAIRNKYRDQERAQAIKERQDRIQEQIAIYQGVGLALAGVNALLAAAYQASGNANYENTVAAKTLGLAQIGVATGIGVAEAIKAGAGLPFPANLAAIATGVGAVTTGVANAINLLNQAQIQKPSFSGGAESRPQLQNVPLGERGGIFEGPSHSKGGLKVYDPLAQKVVAEVEGGEPWMVLSRAFRANNADLLPLIMRASASGERLPLAGRGGIFSPVPSFNFQRATDAINVVRLAEGGIMPAASERPTRGTALVNMQAPDDDHGAESLAVLKSIDRRLSVVEKQRIPDKIAATVGLGDVEKKTALKARIKAMNTAKRLKTSD